MTKSRYSSVAISLHWLIALLLVGLVVLGKVMNSYADDDPLRFELIQWHKSFGVLLLLLVVLRLLWRLTHRPPGLPKSIKKLERIAAGGAHFILYFLMFAIPLSGWFMVSASPLGLKTELFFMLPWPHVAWFENVSDKVLVTERLVNIHHWLAQGLLAVVILHIAAALRHHFFLKDKVMSRVFLSAAEHSTDRNHGFVPGILLILAGALYLVNSVQNSSYSQASGLVVTQQDLETRQAGLSKNTVGFTALQLGEPVVGVFQNVELLLKLDVDLVSSSTLSATVQTNSVSTGDSQIDATVVTADWFASEQYPTATFESSNIEKQNNKYQVTGELDIRGVVEQVTFLMHLSQGVATGELVIDRKVFGIGVGGQDNFVDPMVTISFEVINKI